MNENTELKALKKKVDERDGDNFYVIYLDNEDKWHIVFSIPLCINVADKSLPNAIKKANKKLDK